ncbi:MAG: type II toxin-antitoxin system RelE/ParE family toxin [Methanospirillum sp.]
MPDESPPTYTVVWPRAAQKMLARLPPEVQERIIDQVESIAAEPFAYVRKVEGSPYHRLRVGDYRVVMQITASHLTIFVVRVAPRKNAYRGL